MFFLRMFLLHAVYIRTLISQILRMGGREQPPIDKRSRRMRNDCGCSVVVAHERDCTLMPRILLIGRPGLTQIDKKSRRLRTGCCCSVVVAHERDCTLMPRILLMSRPGLTQINKKSRRMRNGCFGQISLFVTARALAQDDEKLREHS